MVSALGQSVPPTGDRPHRTLLAGKRPLPAHVAVYAFVTVPLVALIVAVPLSWGHGLTWLDVILTAAWYTATCLGVTVGFHRHFTHRSFKATRPLRIALAVVGSMAVQGPILHWVADHRRHHAYSDRDGDPHSPWAFGTSPAALARGFWHAHLGWILNRDLTNQRRFAPDLLEDRDLRRVDDLFWLWTVITLAGPALIGGLVTWSWWGAATAFLWASLLRVVLLHHITWSVNSVCHLIGDRPFASRDKSGNVWPLAILSMGESWHNLHHADPTCARHGVRPGQIDISARLIWIFERAGWAYDVRWPTSDRLARLSVAAGADG
ncbi:acyl-CoA desaturase [Rugosimonospora africana]|uniref:Stearoyl-CoA desaturase n=1 Tax=Rugosimonospora africana TaxID=556532 RepID=A0A8J3QS95_9ACTN|nr:acyl-CoA desaturase [Rugosimonospora africana]GIH15754.1 stearoyl-CoA desaturase [Rugosimonospora africana]